MIEILFSPVNIGLTLLCILLVAYWLLSLIGGLDFDLDFDADFDVDIDADADFDTGSGIETSFSDTANVEVNREDVLPKRRQSLKWWQVFLVYFNFVGLPFMFTLTAFVFIWWLLSISFTSWLHLHHSNVGVLIVLACIIPALFIEKIVTSPFKTFFQKLNKDGDQPIDFVGRRGRCLSNLQADKMGSAEVIIDGNPYNIYIKSHNGEPIAYGQTILIIGEAADKTFYFVEQYLN